MIRALLTAVVAVFADAFAASRELPPFRRRRPSDLPTTLHRDPVPGVDKRA